MSSTEVLIGDIILTSPSGDGIAIPWSSEPREGLAICRAKVLPSFLSYFKTLSIGPTAGIEPATSRSAVKRSIDWANPTAEILNEICFRFNDRIEREIESVTLSNLYWDWWKQNGIPGPTRMNDTAG